MEPFYLNSTADLYVCLEYRLRCKQAGKRGTVIENGIRFDITENGCYHWDGNVPDIENAYEHLLMRLAFD